MKKTEMLIAVEDYLSVKGVTLDDFYSVEVMPLNVILQGHFQNDITRKLGTGEFAVMPTGYVETNFSVIPENSAPINVLVTLT